MVSLRVQLACSTLVLPLVWFHPSHADVRPRVESRWPAQPPTIDGQHTDWNGLLTRLDTAPVSIGVQNDGEFLYVGVVTSDPGMRALLSRAGFTMWWDPASKDRKASGLRVPALVTLVPPEPAEGNRPRRTGGGPVHDFDPIGHLEVIGPEKEDRRRLEMTYLRTIGFDAAGTLTDDVLAYELKVPLVITGGSPYAIGAKPGAGLSLGIETGEMPKYRPPDEGRRGRPGGLGGFGRRAPAGTGGPGGPGGPDRPPGEDEAPRARPLRIWLDLRLAVAASGS